MDNFREIHTQVMAFLAAGQFPEASKTLYDLANSWEPPRKNLAAVVAKSIRESESTGEISKVLQTAKTLFHLEAMDRLHWLPSEQMRISIPRIVGGTVEVIAIYPGHCLLWLQGSIDLAVTLLKTGQGSEACKSLANGWLESIEPKLFELCWLETWLAEYATVATSVSNLVAELKRIASEEADQRE